jgi:hypothetical protein
LGESRVVERPVVVVGAEREKHADLRARLGGQAGDRLQKVLSLGLFGEREHLLELVDHQEETPALGQRPERRPRIRAGFR